MEQKHIPFVGEQFYTYTPCNSYYVRICRDPWTVESVNAKGTEIVVRAAKLVFEGPLSIVVDAVEMDERVELYASLEEVQSFRRCRK